MAINKGEFGQVLRADMGEDVSTNIGLEFVIQPEAGDGILVTDQTGVTVGTTDVAEGDFTYQANQYLQYTTKENDIKQSGRYRKKGIAKISINQTKVGNFERFTVLP